MLYELARVHRGRLFIAYLLTSIGMVAGLLYPLATGLAINGVLSGDYLAVLWLVGCHAAQLLLTVASKRYDTRVFTRIYAVLASTVVGKSRADGLDPARVAARASLSREYTDFLEEDVSRILYAAIALTISLSALAFLQPALAFACLALGGPLLLIGRWLGRRSGQLNKGLNNRLESEVSLLSDGNDRRVRRHFEALAGWRIKLSDAEATAFGLMEMLVIVLFVAALWQVGAAETKPQAGDVFAIFSYLWRFVESLDQVPVLIQKSAKLRDLDQRLASAVDQAAFHAGLPRYVASGHSPLPTSGVTMRSCKLPGSFNGLFASIRLSGSDPLAAITSVPGIGSPPVPTRRALRARLWNCRQQAS